MDTVDQDAKIDQTDFALIKVPARHWSYQSGQFYKTGQQARFMWLPISKRAKAWFSLAVYECNDKKFQKEVRIIFSTNRLKISTVYTGDMNWVHCSRLKDINVLVELLDGMEKLFELGYHRGPFKKIMASNPAAADYWALIECIKNEHNGRVSKRFMRQFAGAMVETYEQLLA